MKYIEFLGRQHRFNEAEAHLKESLQMKPNSAQLQRLAASITQRKRRPLRFFYKADDSSSPRHGMWNRFLSNEERIKICRDLIDRDKDDFDAHYCLGRILLLGTKNAAAAEKHLKRATELQPDNPKVQLLYAEVLEKLNCWNEALAILNVLSKQIPNDSELHNSRGSCLKGLRQWTEAERAYDKAIKLSKARKAAKFLNNLALLFSAWPDASRVDEGLEICKRLEDNYPTYPWTSKTRLELERRKLQKQPE